MRWLRFPFPCTTVLRRQKMRQLAEARQAGAIAEGNEAQAIPVESLEALRLLTNLETENRKLLKIVLFGQPELNCKLELDSIR